MESMSEVSYLKLIKYFFFSSHNIKVAPEVNVKVRNMTKQVIKSDCHKWTNMIYEILVLMR